jgi:hypothetical protein
MSFKKKQNREQEGKISPVWGIATSGRGQDIRRKGCRRVNRVEILSIHVYKWKNETC